jgi:hypothetical protein
MHARTPLLAIACVTACMTGCAEPPTLGSAASEIRGGTSDDGDPAVGAISVLGLYSYCTATLIAPHTVLTAGHCNLDGMEVDFGADSDSPTQAIDVTDVKVHPMYTGEGKPFDVAVMKLKSDAQGITPLVLNATPVTADQVGQMIRHVGFGVTDDATDDGGGIKRTVSYPISKLDGMLLYSGAPGEQTCTGDSGGPGLMALPGQTGEAIVGVVSDGPDCQLSQDGWDDRVDAVIDWVMSTVSAWDAPPTVVGGDGSGGSSGSGGTISQAPGSGDDDSSTDGTGGSSPSGAHMGGCSVGGDGSTDLAPWLLLASVLAFRGARAARATARRPRS